MTMTKEELMQWQTEVRQKKSEEFGEIGVKTDCQNFHRYYGLQDCKTLTELCCKTGVCQFYKRKE